MWIVRARTPPDVHLRRPRGPDAVLGAVSINRMATDVPGDDVPVVSIVWRYTGMPADEMSRGSCCSTSGCDRLGQRYRARRASRSPASASSVSTSTRGQDRGGRGPGHGHLPGPAQAHASRHHPRHTSSGTARPACRWCRSRVERHPERAQILDYCATVIPRLRDGQRRGCPALGRSAPGHGRSRPRALYALGVSVRRERAIANRT